MEFMTDPQQLAAQTWKNAEALIEHFERVLRAGGESESLLGEMVSRLRTTTNAQSVSLLATESGENQTLALSGVAISVSDDMVREDDSRLSVSRIFSTESKLELNLCFDEPVPLAIRQPVVELCEALLDLAGGVYLQSRVADLKRNLRARGDRDAWIESLYEGVAVQDSFVAIAASLASRIVVDRVSLMRSESAGLKLIASSNQASIDRRATQVRLLELAAGEITSAHSEFTIGPNTKATETPALQDYLDRSGCQEIHIETVPQSDAVIVLERFQLSADPESLAAQLDPFRKPVQFAIANAIKRDNADWAQIASRLSQTIKRPNVAYLAGGAFLILVASMLIRVPLKIAVDGKVTAVDASRIYAPAEGIVDEVLVNDGDTVSKGTPLVRLRSPELDLQQRALEGTMMTARNRLDSLQISRTGRRFGDEGDGNLSADEKVLKTEIDGLEKQLELIQAQQSSLLVTSPIDGRIDGWDLHASLQARPVAVGQFLLNVISEAAGWKVQLNIPDENIGYLLEQQQTENCSVRFRLRSDATVVHESKIETIADSARVDQQGNSIVLAILPFRVLKNAPVRQGATVLAQVDCGNRAVGFVWLRGLIEWWRTSSWF
jgi:hypothetical protein